MYQSMRAMCRKRYRDETKFAKIVHVRHDVRTTLKRSTRACLTAVGGRTVGLCEAFGSFERRREKGRHGRISPNAFYPPKLDVAPTAAACSIRGGG